MSAEKWEPCTFCKIHNNIWVVAKFEIFSRQAEQSGKLTYRIDRSIVLSHKNTAMCVFNITLKCIIVL